jgi:hypothetical protein
LIQNIFSAKNFFFIFFKKNKIKKIFFLKNKFFKKNIFFFYFLKNKKIKFFFFLVAKFFQLPGKKIFNTLRKKKINFFAPLLRRVARSAL